ncbi:hypothetical protein DL769_001273 [Monosporascus sp. CRB-8-3]|nr:hypothetical protein DL769_001273 [Monosporascus sp. CRB-8-3]
MYWMVNLISINAPGIECENMAMVIDQPWTALWVIFWVITNASRQISFDLHSCIGLNLGLLFAWSAVNVALFPLCCYFMSWRSERGQRAAGRDKGKYAVNNKDGEKESRKDVGAKPPKRRRGFMRGM